MKIVDLSELALKKVKISGNVIGKFGSFLIEQVYKNESKSVLEVGYTFPIVSSATVVGFEINVGDKVLKGVCKEKGEAKKEYLNNIVKGNSAYLMEQKSDNIFEISIGKIAKNEEVKVKIFYIDKFDIIDNTINVLIPTLVTPRYKSDITSDLEYGSVSYTVDFNIDISKSLNCKSIGSSSHKIKVLDGSKVDVLDYDLSRDFKLNIELKNEVFSSGVFSKTKDGKDVVYLSFMPEILDSYEDSPKEYLFIVDVSGSMYGRKLDETKNAVIHCLKQLDVGDHFNIIPFESDFEAMSVNSLEFNSDNLDKAINYVNGLKALGGTEILEPLKFALYDNSDDKVILLFTDGQVGNESEIIKFVDDNIKKSRIFSFGIDMNVNSYFIKELAKVGNGKSELIQPKEKIDDKIIRTFSRIQTPLLEDLVIDYGKNKVIDEIREDKCLFNYEFFNVFVKVEKLVDDICLKGSILGKEYSWKISNINSTDVDLEVLFAKEEIDRLEEYMRNSHDDSYKDMIIDLAVKYNINSKYTSFITVYERKNKLFEVPKHQETILSNKFLEKSSAVFCETAFMGMSSAMSGSNMMFAKRTGACFDACCDMEVPMEDGSVDILEEKVDEYYEKFIKLIDKSILTFLLYSVYFLKKGKNIDFDMFIDFVKEHKDDIINDDICLKLLLVCYDFLDDSYKSCVYDLMDNSFKKVISTNMKVKLNFEHLSQLEIKNIVDSDSFIDNIDVVLKHLI